MKIFSWIFNKIKLFFRGLSKLLPLLISIVALYVAFESMNNANRQFQINSETSDSLFNIQLKNSKELNDYLIIQISKLQEITKQQLKITDEQLNISIELLKDQIYSGRPKIAALSNRITDTVKTLDYIFSPRIETAFQNIGKRFADKLTIRTFILFNNFSTIRADILPKASYFVEPNAKITRHLIPSIDKKYKDNFYYCYDIIYYDEKLKINFTQAYYFRYYKLADRYDFYRCKINDEEKIRESLNNSLRTNNERLFDQ
jgi:hypothetical protein